MNRREFIKISSLTSAALLLEVHFPSIKSLAQPAIIDFKGFIFRGTQEGDILISHDSGKTWQVHTHLGKDYSILSLSKEGSQHLHSKVAYGGRSFDLTLAQGGNYWLSAG